MVNKAHGLDRLRIVQGDGERTLIGTHFTAALVTVLKNVVGAGVAEHIDARVARDLLRAVAPENNLALEIENTDANLQAVEDVTVNVGVLESCHGARPNARCLFHRQRRYSASAVEVACQRVDPHSPEVFWLVRHNSLFFNCLRGWHFGVMPWHESAICRILREV